MANFSVNQVRQLYVANELKTPHVVSTDNVGSIAVVQVPEDAASFSFDKKRASIYFEYKGAGGMTRSDLINIGHILAVKATDADDLAHELAKYKVTLDSTINGGTPVVGQDYLLRIAFRNYIGLSDEDQYFKYGMVHAVSGMTASNFYKTLALSLVKNFSREEEGLLNFYLEEGGSDVGTVAGTPTLVTKDTKADDLTGTYTGVVIEEAPQEWILGVMEQVPVNFTLQPDLIIADGDERIWGIVKKVASTNSIPDGHKIADLEYFCMGERGDIYRMVGFPNVIRTKYLVNPDNKYNVIDIHYAFTDSNESVQKSEKDITLVVPKIGDNNSVSNKLTNDIITAINTATGLSIPTLDASAGD